MVLLTSHCGGGGGGGESAPAAGVQVQDTVATGPDATQLNLKEATPASLQSSGGAVAFSALQGAPPAGASGGPSINAYYIPAKAFDGNSVSWWAGDMNAGAWDLFYGFSSPVALETVYINFYGDTYAPASVTLNVSADGLNWTAIGSNTTRDSKPLFIIPQPAPVSYIHIAMTGDPATGYPLIRDIDWTPPVENSGPYATPGVNDNHYFSSNALDGDTNTWWVGKVDAGQWDFYNHFDSPQYIGMFSVELFNLNYRPQSMMLYVSDNGIDWTGIGELTAGGAPSIFAGRSTSYWLLRMTGNPSSKFPLVKDISYVLPTGASSGDSINAYYKPENAFDGNVDTWWTGKQNQEEWNLFYGYATPTAVNTVSIDYYAATHAPQQTELLVSDDGQAWTSLGVFPPGDDPSLLAGQTTTYLRFKMTGAPSVGYPLIRDIFMSGGEDPCSIACTDAEGCDDGDGMTVDTCMDPGLCTAACSHEPITSACTSDSDCDDDNSATTDRCYSPGSPGAYCENSDGNMICFLPNDTHKYRMVTSGRFTAFEERNQDLSIQTVSYYDHAAKQKYVAVDVEKAVITLDVSENYLVWSELMENGDRLIRMRDMLTGQQTEIVNSSIPLGLVHNYKNQVVWGNGDIYHYDGNTNQITNLSQIFAIQAYCPVIHDNTVVFTDLAKTGIYAYEIGQSASATFLTSANTIEIEFDGQTIVWTDYRNNTSQDPYDPNTDIYMYSMSTGQTTQVTTDVHMQEKPTVSGNHIVWYDSRRDPNGIYPHYSDIFMYDINTGIESWVTDHLTDPAIPLTANWIWWPSVIGDTIAFVEVETVGQFNAGYACKYTLP